MAEIGLGARLDRVDVQLLLGYFDRAPGHAAVREPVDDRFEPAGPVFGGLLAECDAEPAVVDLGGTPIEPDVVHLRSVPLLPVRRTDRSARPAPRAPPWPRPSRTRSA